MWPGKPVQNAGLHINDVDAFVPHPGSFRILQNVAESLEIPSTKVLTTLSDTGNTSRSSIPLALDRYWGNRRDSNWPLAMAAFGAGFTSAAAVGKVVEVQTRIEPNNLADDVALVLEEISAERVDPRPPRESHCGLRRTRWQLPLTSWSG